MARNKVTFSFISLFTFFFLPVTLNLTLNIVHNCLLLISVINLHYTFFHTFYSFLFSSFIRKKNQKEENNGNVGVGGRHRYALSFPVTLFLHIYPIHAFWRTCLSHVCKCQQLRFPPYVLPDQQESDGGMEHVAKRHMSDKPCAHERGENVLAFSHTIDL